jgi:hypothetical protein
MPSQLPVLPFWYARSFWAQLLLAGAVILNTMGVDLFALTAEIGLGTDPHAIIATGEQAISAFQQLLPIVFGFWAWIERRAPKFRLGWG